MKALSHPPALADAIAERAKYGFSGGCVARKRLASSNFCVAA
jgi:hypothetical protein